MVCDGRHRAGAGRRTGSQGAGKAQCGLSRRWKVIALVLVLTVLAGTALSLAEPIDLHPPAENNSGTSGSVAGGMLSTLLAMPIEGIVNALLMFRGFYSIDELVFGGAGAFTQEEWDKVVGRWWAWAGGISTAAQVVALVVMLLGLKTLGAAFSPGPQKRAEIQESLLNILVAAAFVVTGPYLLSALLWLNTGIVEAVRAYLNGLGVDLTTLGARGLLDSVQSGNNLLNAIIRLAFVGMMFHFNMMYLVRRFVLAILIVVMPIVAWSWAFKRTQMPMMILLSELVTNSLMSATHAVVLAFYLTLANANPAGMMGQWWAKLFALSLVIPTSALLRRMIAGWLNFLGIDEEKWAGLATAGFTGLAGLASLAGTAGGATLNTIGTGAGAAFRWLRGKHERGAGQGVSLGAPSPGLSINRSMPVPPGTAGGGSSPKPGTGSAASRSGGPQPFSNGGVVAGGTPGLAGGVSVTPGSGTLRPLSGSGVVAGQTTGSPAGASVGAATSPPALGGGPGGDVGAPVLDAKTGLTANDFNLDSKSGLWLPATMGSDQGMERSPAQESKQPQGGWGKYAEPVRRGLDIVENAFGTFGRFAGGVMAIGVGGQAGSQYVHAMELAARAPFAFTKRAMDIMANRKAPSSLDGPRWR